MQQMSLDGLLIKSTENYKKFYDYLAKNYARFARHNGENNVVVLKEVEEVIYMLLLLILSEDEEPEPENKDGINMLYDTLRVLVQLYNNILNSSDIKNKEKSTLLQHPEVHKLLLSQLPDTGTSSNEKNRDINMAHDLLDPSTDFYNSLGIDGQYIPESTDYPREENELFHDLDSVMASSNALLGLDDLDMGKSSLKMNPSDKSYELQPHNDMDYMVSQHLQGSSPSHMDILSQDQHQYPFHSSTSTSTQHLPSDPPGITNEFPLHLYNQFYPATRDTADCQPPLQTPLGDNTLLQNLQPQHRHSVPTGSSITAQNVAYQGRRSLASQESNQEFYHQQQRAFQHQQQILNFDNSTIITSSSDINNEAGQFHNFMLDFTSTGSNNQSS